MRSTITINVIHIDDTIYFFKYPCPILVYTFTGIFKYFDFFENWGPTTYTGWTGKHYEIPIEVRRCRTEALKATLKAMQYKNTLGAKTRRDDVEAHRKEYADFLEATSKRLNQARTERLQKPEAPNTNGALPAPPAAKAKTP